MTNKSTNPWFICRQPKPHAKLRLFCIPYAGGWTWNFQAWTKNLLESVEVCPIQLPGRVGWPCFSRHQCCLVVRPAKADAFSGRQSHQGKSQR
jgi:hypothetical protein